MSDAEQLNQYKQIIERIFLSRWKRGDTNVPFEREDIAQAAHELGIMRPKNLGDVSTASAIVWICRSP